jgi:hypothetical protein
MYIESKYTPILPYESGMSSKERGRENISMRADVDEIERLKARFQGRKPALNILTFIVPLVHIWKEE